MELFIGFDGKAPELPLVDMTQVGHSMVRVVSLSVRQRDPPQKLTHSVIFRRSQFRQNKCCEKNGEMLLRSLSKIRCAGVAG